MLVKIAWISFLTQTEFYLFLVVELLLVMVAIYKNHYFLIFF